MGVFGKAMLAGALLAGSLLFGMLATSQFVRTQEGLHLIEKQQVTFADTYLDIRDWTPADYLSDWDTTRHLCRHGVIGAELLASLERGSETLRSLGDLMQSRPVNRR